MFRIDNSTSVASLPIIPPIGNPGYFFRGDEVADVPATVVDDWWANTIQEEILTVVVNAGLIPNKNDHTQLWQAINALIGAGGGGGGGEPDYDPFLPLTGGTLYQPVANDILTIAADPGYYARTVFTATGRRSWAVGADPAGVFGISDVSAGGTYRLYIETTGRVVANNGLAVVGSLECSAFYVHGGGATVDGTIASGTSVTSVLDISAGRNLGASGSIYSTHNVFIGANGINLYDEGGNYLAVSSHLDVKGNLQSQSFTCYGNAGVNGSLSIGSQITFGGGANALQYVGGGVLIDYGNFRATGNIVADAIVQAGQLQILGTATLYGDLHVQGGAYFVGISASATISALNFQAWADAAINGSVVLQSTSQISWGGDAFLYRSGAQWVNVSRNLAVDGDFIAGATTQLKGSTYIGGALYYNANPSASWIVYPIPGDNNHLEFFDVSGNWCCLQLHNYSQRTLAFKDLETNGNLIYHGGLINASDLEIKRDVQPYGAGLAEIMRLSPVSYEFDPTPHDLTPDGLAHGHAAPGTTPHGRRPEGRYVGLIAQDVEPVIPEMVMERFEIFDGGEPIKFLKTDMLNYVLINAVKELAARVDALEGESHA